MSNGAVIASAVPRQASRAWYGTAASMAWLAGVFCLVVCALLVWNHGHRNAEEMRTALDLASLKTELQKSPEDPALKQRIRALDLSLRHEFFQRQTFSERGTWLLLMGAMLFVSCAKYAGSRPKLPAVPLASAAGLTALSAAPVKPFPADAKARIAVGGVGVALAAGIIFLLGTSSREVTGEALVEHPTPRDPQIAAAPLPSAEEIRKNWPRFRGPDGQGVVTFANIPTEWDGKSGNNIFWKSAVPLPGHNSPIVWGDRVFVTGADAQKREVYCFHAQSGLLQWQQSVGQTAGDLNVMDDTGYAASTAATDGVRVFAIFATGDLVCLTFDGKPVWNKRLGTPDNQYGYASSLATWKNLLLVQFDAREEGKGKLLALDGATGKQVWAATRPVADSWSTPLVVQAGDKAEEQLITCGKPWVIAYEPAAGKELWRADCLTGDVAPSPAFGAGMVFVANDNSQAAAIKADGSGDVTKTHIAWTATEGLPDICSPLCDGQRVYLLSSGGTLTCYGAADGKKLWDKGLDLQFNASPSLVGTRLYLLSADGVMVFAETGNEYKEAGRAELGEACRATPAFADGRIYIRTEKNLYAIGPGGK